MKKLTSILLSLLILIVLSGQSNAEWVQTIRLYPSSIVQSVKQTKDGGYIILAGNTSAGADYWVIKLKNNGDIEWQKTYGLKDESGNDLNDGPYSIEQTSDGGYVMVGNSDREKTWILKIDETGNIEWQKASLYWSDNTGTFGYDVKQTTDGGYAFIDRINQPFGRYDFGLTKLNHDGSFAWRGAYGNANAQYPTSFQITDDGGFIIAGYTIDSDDYNFSIVRINSSGSIVWQKQYVSDDLKTNDNHPIIRNTPDGGFIVGGYTQAYGNDTWLLKLDSDGNILWQKRYYDSTPGVAQQDIYDIQSTSDGGYIFVGISGELWIVKINSEGSVLWDKSYPLSTGPLRAVRSVEETSDGGYIIGGAKMYKSTVYWDVLLMKINKDGDIPGCSLTSKEGFTIAVDINGKAIDTNYGERIIQDPSMIDTNSIPITTYATGSYLCLNPNHPPVADPNGPYLGAAGSSIVFDGTGSFDPDEDSLTFEWDWGYGEYSQDGGSNPTHTYYDANIYNVCLTVNDGTVDSEQVCTFAVVYDPDAGFVTGGGWIDSPAKAYMADPELAGKANFGFVSKYKKGATIPTGQTEFQFQTANLNFHSSSYDWLVVTGSDYAKFKGSGTINGEGNYKFMLWAGDSEPDTFRIRIWEEDEETAEEKDIYDNGFDQKISGGSIVVHTN